MKDDSIIIFTDGSSRGNPGPGGSAAIILIPGEDRVIEVGEHEEKTTNNRMELQGAICALIAIRQFPGDVVIHTDSSYLIQGMTKWVDGWIKNGWITTNKEDVINRDLWEILTSLLYEREEKFKVSWKHISGHSGIAGNERCDVIATALADRKEIKLYDGPIDGYDHDLTSIISDGAKKEMKGKKKNRSKKKAYSYISMLGGDIQTHATWDECEARVKGKSGAKFKKTLNKEEEDQIHSEWSKK